MNIDEIEEKIDEALIEFEQDPSKREEVEKYFSQKTAILLEEAKRAHPLSETGINKLLEAVKARKTIEDIIGPMITRITAGNIDLFETVLTEDQKEDILTGRRSAIGALRTSFETVYGVGALVYHINRRGFHMMLEVEWLFVDGMFRNQKVANFLMGEIVSRMVNVGIGEMQVNIPVKQTNNPVPEHLLKSWQIEFDYRLSPEIVIDVADVSEYDRVAEIGESVGDMSKLTDSQLHDLLKNAQKKFDYSGYLSSKRLPGDYINKACSGYIGTVDDPKALVLVHRTPSGILRAEYCEFEEKRDAAKLYVSVLFRVMNGAADDLVLIPADEQMSEFFEKICPDQRYRYTLSGSLTARDDII